jgi:hypothetical protein
LVNRVIRVRRACVGQVAWLLNVCRQAIEYHPWVLGATAGVHGSVGWPIDRCAPRHVPCADAAVGADGHQSSAAAVVRTCSQRRLRALRMRVGGLVRHRVACMHALAHAG